MKDESGRHRTGVGLGHWGDEFPDTHWTVLYNPGGAPGSASHEDKFTHLCSRYWYPLYAFLRKRGYASHDAQDLTQGFFAHLVSGDRIANVDPSKGRFRTYLLGAMTHYLNDRRKFQNAEKRGGGKAPISIEAELAENRFQNEPAHDLTPEKFFDRKWAMTVLSEASRRLEQEYTDKGKASVFGEIGDYLTSTPPPGAYAEMAGRLGQKEDNVRAMVSRMRKRYKTILREQVLATVSSVDDIDGEIRELLDALGS